MKDVVLIMFMFIVFTLSLVIGVALGKLEERKTWCESLQEYPTDYPNCMIEGVPK